MNYLYFDNSSTTKIDEDVAKLVFEISTEHYGNPSSLHSLGQGARKQLEESREKISNLLSVEPKEIIFTASGSEGNNMIIRGVTELKKGHIISSSFEHSSVIKLYQELEKTGWDVSYIPIEKNGVIHIDTKKKIIRDDTILISIMHVNNELGTIQPIEIVGELCKEKGILFHVDGVQSVGKIPINLTNIDFFTFSAHKFYGPKGVGGIVAKKHTKLNKLIFGGSQERNRRGGTENTPGVFGMAKAMELAMNSLEDEQKREYSMRETLEKFILSEIPNSTINGKESQRVASISNVTFSGVSNESLMMVLDRKNIGVSAGSACASGSLVPSHVLKAILLSDDEAKSSIRISLGKYNTQEEIETLCRELKKAVELERNFSL